MTPCQDIRAGLDDWLDGLATAEVQVEIDAHLAACAACARFFEDQRRLAGGLQALGAAADRLAATSYPATQPARSWRGWRAWRAAAAAVIVIGAGVFLAEFRLPGRSDQQAELVPPRPDTPVAVALPEFSFVVPDQCLAVRMESSNPRIHIVWLYKEMQGI